MIPDFDEHGYLPPGVYPVTIEEIASRFGWQSEPRQVQIESLRWLLEAARRARILRIVIDGSFATDRLEPNDVDCALLLDPDSPLELETEIEALEDLPFLHVFVLRDSIFEQFVNAVFGKDRRNIGKGVIEVTAWT